MAFGRRLGSGALTALLCSSSDPREEAASGIRFPHNLSCGSEGSCPLPGPARADPSRPKRSHRRGPGPLAEAETCAAWAAPQCGVCRAGHRSDGFGRRPSGPRFPAPDPPATRPDSRLRPGQEPAIRSRGNSRLNAGTLCCRRRRLRRQPRGLGSGRRAGRRRPRTGTGSAGSGRRPHDVGADY